MWMSSALSTSIPWLRCPWANHRTHNCSPGCLGVCSWCVFSLMCVCTLYVLNAEHNFWVWVTILCRMSLSLSNKSIRVVGSGNMCDMRDLSWIYSSKSLSAIHRLKKKLYILLKPVKSISEQLPTNINFHTHCGTFHVHNSLWPGPLQEWQAPVCDSTFKSRF